MDESELLDWLCWMWAQDGEEFFPPDETAQACMDGLPDDRYEEGSLEEAEALGWERGQHARVVTTAAEMFDQLYKRGFDPKERAERYHEQVQEEAKDRSGEPLDDLDWSWYEAFGRKG